MRAKGLIGRTLLQSFDVQVLRDARAIAPDLRLGLLRSTIDADPVATSRELGVVTYNPSWNALRPRAGEVERLNAAGIAVMPYTVDDPAQWPAMRDAGVDAVITNRSGALVGWNARYEQAGSPLPPLAEILAPAAGARLERGDAVAVAVKTGGARDVVITLDGEPVAEGTVLRGEELERGEHVIGLSADGETAEAAFEVIASPDGLAHLIATADRPGDGLKVHLLRIVFDRQWGRLIRAVEREEGELGQPLARLIAEDAAALSD